MSGGEQQFDARPVEYRQIWDQKPTLRRLYADYHRRLLAECGDGPVLDIGGGTANIKDVRKDVVSIDILPFRGIDVACDAHRLPFPNGYFSGIVMLDVLHHLARPVAFLQEAARVLRPGGRLTMIEPGMSTVAYPFYRFLHEEPAEMGADPFYEPPLDAERDPFDSNQAIPTLLFENRDNVVEVKRRVPELVLKRVDWLSLFAYPLSGGFKRWCLVPDGAVNSVLCLEDALPRWVRRFFGFRLFVTLEKQSVPERKV
ncbi:class I SAM-dependent methyltransferase [Rhodopseudomonas boonkerdii]|uniref:class I SAM-dependent methyltransferase n=1 Tax=Rhodopseudomonas boonkerdii TaxID=475937 RepID=UPI001E43979C|nr:class I SAM-dependent methyltransferase [Rhodopseudomonas boonkerdii]UGV25858.1 class I SAM-dependent methyltransferase [Rhodopseudomonas boonkerdii]